MMSRPLTRKMVDWMAVLLLFGWSLTAFAQFGMGSLFIRKVALTVTYHGNGSTSGTAPTDSTSYLQTGTVTVLGNSGSLAKTGYAFYGWNTQSDGNGTTYAQGSSFGIGMTNVTLYANWIIPPVCGGAGDGCYDDTAAMSIGVATTPLGKSLEYVYANGASGFKVWKEVGGSRVLRATGMDVWAKQVNYNGQGQSATDFTDTNLGTASTALYGRVCPANVYIDDSNKFTTGNCLYYSRESNSFVRLDAAGTSQTIYGQLGLGAWTGYNGGVQKWFTGNVQGCASKGMRLVTLYESNAPMSPTDPVLPPSDGTPTFAGGNGVPCATGYYCSTATAGNVGINACPASKSYMTIAGISICDDNNGAWGYGYQCVLP